MTEPGKCDTCIHANGEGRWDDTPTFEKDGYAICDKVEFNAEPFWDYEKDADGKFAYKPGTTALISYKVDPPVAWVVDASDYWAALHVTPDFGCVCWEARP